MKYCIINILYYYNIKNCNINDDAYVIQQAGEDFALSKTTLNRTLLILIVCGSASLIGTGIVAFEFGNFTTTESNSHSIDFEFSVFETSFEQRKIGYSSFLFATVVMIKDIFVTGFIAYAFGTRLKKLSEKQRQHASKTFEQLHELKQIKKTHDRTKTHTHSHSTSHSGVLGLHWPRRDRHDHSDDSDHSDSSSSHSKTPKSKSKSKSSTKTKTKSKNKHKHNNLNHDKNKNKNKTKNNYKNKYKHTKINIIKKQSTQNIKSNLNATSAIKSNSITNANSPTNNTVNISSSNHQKRPSGTLDSYNYNYSDATFLGTNELQTNNSNTFSVNSVSGVNSNVPTAMSSVYNSPNASRNTSRNASGDIGASINVISKDGRKIGLIQIDAGSPHRPLSPVDANNNDNNNNNGENIITPILAPVPNATKFGIPDNNNNNINNNNINDNINNMNSNSDVNISSGNNNDNININDAIATHSNPVEMKGNVSVNNIMNKNNISVFEIREDLDMKNSILRSHDSLETEFQEIERQDSTMVEINFQESKNSRAGKSNSIASVTDDTAVSSIATEPIPRDAQSMSVHDMVGVMTNTNTNVANYNAGNYNVMKTKIETTENLNVNLNTGKYSYNRKDRLKVGGASSSSSGSDDSINSSNDEKKANGDGDDDVLLETPIPSDNEIAIIGDDDESDHEKMAQVGESGKNSKQLVGLLTTKTTRKTISKTRLHISNGSGTNWANYSHSEDTPEVKYQDTDSDVNNVDNYKESKEKEKEKENGREKEKDKDKDKDKENDRDDGSKMAISEQFLVKQFMKFQKTKLADIERVYGLRRLVIKSYLLVMICIISSWIYAIFLAFDTHMIFLSFWDILINTIACWFLFTPAHKTWNNCVKFWFEPCCCRLCCKTIKPDYWRNYIQEFTDDLVKHGKISPIKSHKININTTNIHNKWKKESNSTTSNDDDDLSGLIAGSNSSRGRKTDEKIMSTEIVASIN